MAKWEAKNIVLTSEGRTALSKVQSGDGFLTITKVVASSQYVDPANLEQVTVIDPQNTELEIISRRESGDGGSVIQVMLNNVNLGEEFILNQIGVFASHSSNPQVEFLYIIAQVSENSGDRVPVYSVTPVSCTYDIFLYNVKASDIVVNISPNFFVTADDLFSNAKVLRRSFSYKEGDIAYDATLRSCYNLKCVVSGTSSGQTIDFSTYTKGDRITDGGVVWKVIEGAGGGAGGKWSCDKTDLYNVVMRPLTPAEQEDEPDEEEKHTIQEIIDSAVSNKADKLENGHTIVRSINNTYADDNGNVTFNLDGFQVGDTKWTSSDLTQVGWLVANGASVRRDTYPDLFEAIGTRWGSVDDEHFNLPNFIGKFVEGSETAGGYKEAGLPNIKGSVTSVRVSSKHGSLADGAFTVDSSIDTVKYVGSSDGGEMAINFNASRSNKIYGKSNTVQPNSALLIPYIKAFKGASASSTDLEITKVANELNEFKLSVRDYVVESYSDEEGNWYRKYKSGWLEQGGVLPVSSKVINKVVALLKPFATNKYTVLTQNYHNSDTININTHFSDHSISRLAVFNFTTTSFNVYYGNNTNDGLKQKIWYACGQGVEE